VIDDDVGEHRQRDEVIEHEVAVLERERACRALRDEAVAELAGVIR